MLQPKLLQGQLNSKIMEAFWEIIINKFLNKLLIAISVSSVHTNIHLIYKAQLQWKVVVFRFVLGVFD